MFRQQCLLISSTYQHSVDEAMVVFKGTKAGSLRWYIANTPDKWSFKLFCRASSSGIIHGLLLCQGASTFFIVALTQEEELLLGAKLVTTLCKTITLPRLSVVCDNYFTSFDLVQNMQENLGIGCIGTQCLSSVKRWRKDRCPMPIAHAYNQHMGGLDLSEMLVHMYKTLAKSRQWYLPLFGYILDLCISNAWLVYKRDCSLLKETLLPFKRFRLAVAHTLAQVSKPASKVGRPSSSSSPPHMS
ncbi:hypothetical protein JOB18_043507 [Solea senegalensis]|nr:hypothetical protein JOB18_043507 [Solea senegalensis]